VLRASRTPSTGPEKPDYPSMLGALEPLVRVEVGAYLKCLGVGGVGPGHGFFQFRSAVGTST
jgi:hypothetical protein